MKNLILIPLLTFYVLILSAQSNYDSLRYLVVFEEGTSLAEIEQIREEHEAEEIWVSPFSLTRYWQSHGYPHYVNNDLITDVKEEVKRLKSRPVVTGGGLDYDVVSFIEPSNGSGGNQYISCFDSFEPLSVADTNTTIVSILDTGLSPFGIYPPKFTFSYGTYTGYNYLEQNTNVEDDHGHGTHIAGIISHVSQHYDFMGPNQSNINFDIRKTFDSQGMGNISDIVYAFDEAVLLGAKVINMSFSFFAERPTIKPDPLEYCILKASEEQVLVVCAAGNENINNDIASHPAFPSSYSCDNILSVASVDCSSSLSPFSNFGAESVDVTFLGENIPGPSPMGNLVLKNGTSQATAVVSGIATAATSYLDTADYKKVKCAILNTATFHSGLSGLVLSSGVANAYRAATIQALNSCNTYQDHTFQQAPNVSITEDGFKWNIAPNPVKSEVSIQINSPRNDHFHIRIFDVTGEYIYNKIITCKKGINQILLDDLNSLAKGIYFIQIENKIISEHIKFIKL